jgi:hypothetical protein
MLAYNAAYRVSGSRDRLVRLRAAPFLTHGGNLGWKHDEDQGRKDPYDEMSASKLRTLQVVGMTVFLLAVLFGWYLRGLVS